MRGGDFSADGVESVDIAVAEVVGENVENIWFGGGGFLSVSDGSEKPDKGEIDEWRKFHFWEFKGVGGDGGVGAMSQPSEVRKRSVSRRVSVNQGWAGVLWLKKP